MCPNSESKRNFIKVEDFKKFYKICEVIGKGSFGCVYSGVRLDDSLSVAVKHFDKQRVIDWRYINSMDKRIPTEIYLMEKLKDITKIVQIFEWFETENSFIIVMERPLNSIDLFEMKLLKKDFIFSESEVKVIIKQLLETLETCLKRGVIHRDVKPENILINTETLEIKLIDFGAGGYPSDTESDHLRGTIQYMSPEYLLKRCEYKEPQMVWSLGVLLYELICGEIPFENEDQILDYKMGLNFPKTISKEFKNVIQKCLSREAKRRPSIRKLLENKLLKVN